MAFLDFIPQMVDSKSGQLRLPSELKDLSFRSEIMAYATIAILSSSTFFWFWNTLSDCRNLNRRDLLAFPLNPENLLASVQNELCLLGKKYIANLRQTAQTMNKSGLRIETFDYASCKAILDETDRLLAQHYGFSTEELDFIINYDIKYRMGKDASEGEEAEG